MACGSCGPYLILSRVISTRPSSPRGSIWASSFNAWALATGLTVGLAALVYRSHILSSAANTLSAIGLTILAFAVVGIVIAPLGFGVAPAVAVVTFSAILSILRNTIVGLTGVDPAVVDSAVVDSARGIGLGRVRTFLPVELPLARPVIFGGIRVSAQMVMGIAAVAAEVLGPGLGRFIFSGCSCLGGAKRNSGQKSPAVDGITLEIPAGKIAMLVGPRDAARRRPSR